MLSFAHYIVIFLLFQSNVLCSSKPNIVVLFVENINEVLTHFEDVNKLTPLTSNNDLKTLYSLRKESVKFHNVSGEVSSASMFASLFTGKPAVDLGIIRGKLLPFESFPSLASSGGLSTEELSIPKALKRCNYQSWFSGYWKMGLGPSGDNYPIKHGFDTWMGVAHPHNEWCKHENSWFKNQDPFSHPYLKLFYRTSFLWILLFLFMTMMVWFKFISFRLYINLLVYTISTSLAFYILLHLFMVQRSASCVLYYHDFVFQQPYDMNNLTMHFTQHSAKLIDVVSGTSPFFMVLNYLNMKQPYAHSNYFDQLTTRKSKKNALIELDWSIGLLIKKLKENHIYDNTMIVLTGSNSCDGDDADISTVKAYQRRSMAFYENVTTELFWKKCFKATLWIKDRKNPNEELTPISDVYNIIPISDVYSTILDACSCLNTKPKTSKSLLKLFRESTCPKNTKSMYYISKYAKQTFLDISKWSNNTFGSKDTNQSVVDMEWLKDIQNDSYQDHDILFHYYNVRKPVMLTYRSQYLIIYHDLNKFESLEKLEAPIIVDLSNDLDKYTNITEKHARLEELYEAVANKLHDHMIERQHINLWSSQFEMPVYPWLLPCSNFPHCETTYTPENDDFFYIMGPRNNNNNIV